MIANFANSYTDLVAITFNLLLSQIIYAYNHAQDRKL